MTPVNVRDDEGFFLLRKLRQTGYYLGAKRGLSLTAPPTTTVSLTSVPQNNLTCLKIRRSENRCTRFIFEHKTKAIIRATSRTCTQYKKERHFQITQRKMQKYNNIVSVLYGSWIHGWFTQFSGTSSVRGAHTSYRFWAERYTPLSSPIMRHPSYCTAYGVAWVWCPAGGEHAPLAWRARVSTAQTIPLRRLQHSFSSCVNKFERTPAFTPLPRLLAAGRWPRGTRHPQSQTPLFIWGAFFTYNQVSVVSGSAIYSRLLHNRLEIWAAVTWWDLWKWGSETYT